MNNITKLGLIVNNAINEAFDFNEVNNELNMKIDDKDFLFNRMSKKYPEIMEIINKYNGQ